MPVTTLRDDMALRLRVPLRGSRTEEGLAAALDALLATAETFPRPLAFGDDDPACFLVVTFHTPERRWVSERRFFERCARHPVLDARVLRYVEHVNPARWKHDPFHGGGLWTSTQAPAGSLAIVPLALRDASHLAALGEHLRGADLDHETFHRALVTELVKRHGLVPEVLDLLAVRAVDAAGQHGPEDLRWLAAKTAFGKLLGAKAGVEEFAARVDRVSRRTKADYRALYVANAGVALFEEAEPRARWFAFFEARGLRFEKDAKATVVQPPHPPRPFAEEWEACASSDDLG